MALTYKVLSAVLSYPTAGLQGAAKELIQILDVERMLSADKREAVVALIVAVATADLMEAQECYVDLFDRTRALSLHLFEHVHGESRDRGQAMVSLLERYQMTGLDVAARELPDYIPIFLEFLSTRDEGAAREDLSQCVHIFAALGERLRHRGSNYASAFEALVELSRAVPDHDGLEGLRQERMEDPRDLAALDRDWEEAEVRFGPGDAASGGCPRVHDILQRMDVPAAPPPVSSQEEKR